jgi:hypothetical protein
MIRKGLSLLPVDRLSERVALAEALRLAELPPIALPGRRCDVLVRVARFVAQAVETMQLPGLEHARADLFAFLGADRPSLAHRRGRRVHVARCGRPRCWPPSMPGCPRPA